MDEIFICSGNTADISGAPAEIKILPLGNVHSQKGDFAVDKESFEQISKKYKERKVDLVIDYEHQTVMNVQAPAAGWIKNLRLGTDAILADVEWTDKAKEYLKNKEYKYLSPVVLIRETDRKAVELWSAALTNTPAIDGMFAIVNSINVNQMNQKQEGNMDLKKIAKILGLPETATEEEVEKALADAQKVVEEEKNQKRDAETTGKTDEKTGSMDAKGSGEEAAANPTVLSLLNLKADAKTEDVAAAIMTLKAGDGQAMAEVMKLKKEMEEKEAAELVSLALKTGKISAAQKEWAETYALSDKKGFQSFLDKAPVVVPTGKLDLKDAPGNNETGYDLEILKSCGISEEDVKKYYKKES